MLFRHLVLFPLIFVLSSYVCLTHAALDAIFVDPGEFDANVDKFIPLSNRVCLGDGMGHFACSDVSADTDFSLDVALGDVNDDTFLDAVFATRGKRIPLFGFGGAVNRVCLGDGAGHFACSDVSADAYRSRGVALGDVSDDTFLDAVFANSGQSNADVGIRGAVNRVCLGDGASRFACSDVSADVNVSGDVALGNVNGDSFLDAVFANSRGSSGSNPIDPPSGVNRVCLGDGAGHFACSDVSVDTNESSGVALGDVNDDTFLDAVFANRNEQNRVCLGDGAGHFTCNDISADNNLSWRVALGNVNGDSFLDAVFASYPSNQVCLGNGAGGFTCSDVSVDPSEDVALGDVNGDSFLDAVFANSSESSRVCLGDGTGGFTCSDISADTNNSKGVALGEVDKAAMITPAPIPGLSLWAWFLLSILLTGTATIVLRTVL